jgi:HEAT repeat protein
VIVESPRRRGPVLLVGLVVLLAVTGVGVGLGWWLMRPKPTPVTEMHFLADDSHYVVDADVAALRGSVAYARLREKGAGLDAAEVQALEKAIGLPLDQVSRLTLAGSFYDARHTVLVVKTTKEVSYLSLLGGRLDTYKEEKVGKRALRVAGEEAVYLPDGHTVVRGSAEAIRAALQRNRPANLSEALREALADRDVGDHFTVVAEAQALGRDGGKGVIGVDLRRLLPSLPKARAVRLSGRADAAVEVTAVVYTSDPRELSGELARGVKSLRRSLDLSGADGRLLDAIQVATGDGRFLASFGKDGVKGVPADAFVAPVLRYRQGHGDYWLKQLGSDVPEKVAEARKKLAEMGPRVVPRLAAVLSDPSPARRKAAAQTLGAMGPDAAGAAPALAKALRDSPPEVKAAAAEALGKIGPPAKAAALEALLAALGDSRLEVSNAAKDALARVGPFARDDWVKFAAVLQDAGQPAASRRYALDTLGELRLPPATALPVYERALKDGNRDVRRQAVRLIARLDRTVRPRAYALLLGALKDDEPVLRTAARLGLERLGDPPADQVPALVELLGPRSAPEVRLVAAQALGRTRGEARGTVLPALLRALREAEGDLADALALALGNLAPFRRQESAEMLALLRDRGVPEQARALAARLQGDIGADNAPAVPTLREALTDPSAAVRRESARALGRIGPRDRAVVTDLTRAAGDPDPAVRAAAMGALVVLRPAGGTLPALLRGAGDGDEAVAQAALAGLARYGPPEKDDLPALREGLSARAARARQYAAAALAEMKAAAAPAALALGKALKEDSDARVRSSAAAALFAIGPKAGIVADKLEMAVQEDLDVGVKTHAAAALARCGQGYTNKALELLFEGLDSKDGKLSGAARLAFKEMSPGWKDAAKDLVQALRRPERRTAATEGLVRLGRGGLPALRDLATSPAKRLRLLAVETMGAVGPAALVDLRALELDERDEEVRRALRKQIEALMRAKKE